MKRFIGLVAISFALTNAIADENKDEFFGYSGGVGTFSKFGFNNAKIDTTYNFKTLMDSNAIDSLKIGVGIAGGG